MYWHEERELAWLLRAKQRPLHFLIEFSGSRGSDFAFDTVDQRTMFLETSGISSCQTFECHPWAESQLELSLEQLVDFGANETITTLIIIGLQHSLLIEESDYFDINLTYVADNFTNLRSLSVYGVYPKGLISIVPRLHSLKIDAAGAYSGSADTTSRWLELFPKFNELVDLEADWNRGGFRLHRRSEVPEALDSELSLDDPAIPVHAPILQKFRVRWISWLVTRHLLRRVKLPNLLNLYVEMDPATFQNINVDEFEECCTTFVSPSVYLLQVFNQLISDHVLVRLSSLMDFNPSKQPSSRDMAVYSP